MITDNNDVKKRMTKEFNIINVYEKNDKTFKEVVIKYIRNNYFKKNSSKSQENDVKYKK